MRRCLRPKPRSAKVDTQLYRAFLLSDPARSRKHRKTVKKRLYFYIHRAESRNSLVTRNDDYRDE